MKGYFYFLPIMLVVLLSVSMIGILSMWARSFVSSKLSHVSSECSEPVVRVYDNVGTLVFTRSLMPVKAYFTVSDGERTCRFEKELGLEDAVDISDHCFIGHGKVIVTTDKCSLYDVYFV